MVDDDGARLHTLEHSARPAHDRLHLRGAGDAGADDVALRGDLPRRIRPGRAAREQGRRGLPPEIVNHQREPCPEHEARHGRPHISQADEPDPHRVFPLFSPIPASRLTLH